MIKIYCDTADIKVIKKCIIQYKVDGVTTNPSIMRANGVKNYKSQCLKILDICKEKPLSVEVFADKPNEIYSQAKKIYSWNKNLFIKIPIVNTKGIFLNNVIKKVNAEGIKINITAVFTSHQLDKIKLSINRSTPVIISIFCGRIADNGIDPEIIVKKAIKSFKNYKNVKILWASTREVYNFFQANKIGCHIITMGPKFIEKLKSKKLTLNNYSIETVKQFYSDGKKSKFKI
jgi:transaldolase